MSTEVDKPPAASPPPGKATQVHTAVGIASGLVTMVSALCGFFVGVPKLYVVAGLLAMATIGFVVRARVLRARAHGRKRPTRLEVFALLAAVVVAAAVVSVVLLTHSPAPSTQAGGGTAGPAPNSAAAPTHTGGSATTTIPNSSSTNPPPTGNPDAPGPGPNPTTPTTTTSSGPPPPVNPADVGPTSFSQCYTTEFTHWYPANTPQVFELRHNGYLNFARSGEGIQYLRTAQVACGGTLIYDDTFPQFDLTVDGSMIEAGPPPTQARCRAGSDASAKVSPDDQNAYLCFRSGDKQEWVVVKLVDLSALPGSVRVQVVGYFPI